MDQPGKGRTVVIPLIVGGLLGLAVGWGLGAWTACGATCRFDIGLFEAVGTWVGGVGAIAVAVIGGLYARRRRRDAEEQRAAKIVDTAWRAASLCPLRIVLIGTEMGGYQKAEIRLWNRSGMDMAWPLISLDGAPGKTISILKPGRKWTTFVPLDGIGSPQDRKDRGKTKKLARDALEGRLYADFTVGDLRFRRTLTTLTHLDTSDASSPPDGPDVVGPRMDRSAV